MIWLYERGADLLRLETRFDEERRAYVLRVIWSDDHIEVQQFPEASAFAARLRDLERQLTADRWTQLGSPRILSDGWKSGLQ